MKQSETKMWKICCTAARHYVVSKFIIQNGSCRIEKSNGNNKEKAQKLNSHADALRFGDKARKKAKEI